MKINLPVTNTEYVLKETDSIVSETDMKGLITYVNEDFLRISGFSKEELIGTSHNIVRHPDMPPEAFEDLWNSLKAGKPWNGMVKNRCKNGDYYWVMANATPYRENGKLVGITSVRTKPTRAQIEAADAAYRLFRTGKAGKLKIQDGAVVRPGTWRTFKRFKNLSIKARMAFVVGLSSLLLIVVGGMGLSGMDKTNEGLRTVYEDRTVPLGQLGEIKTKVLHMRTAIVTGVGFNAEIPKQHEELRKDIEGVDALWSAYTATP